MRRSHSKGRAGQPTLRNSSAKIRRYQFWRNLGPMQWRGDRRLLASPNGIRRHNSLGKAVSKGIQVNAATSCPDRMLNGQLPWVRGCYPPEQRMGKGQYFVCIRPNLHRHQNMQSMATGRLRPASRGFPHGPHAICGFGVSVRDRPKRPNNRCPSHRAGSKDRRSAIIAKRCAEVGNRRADMHAGRS